MSEVTFYRGNGNHSVYELEKMVRERDEDIYQRQLEKQELELKLVEAKQQNEEICDVVDNLVEIVSDPTSPHFTTNFHRATNLIRRISGKAGV